MERFERISIASCGNNPLKDRNNGEFGIELTHSVPERNIPEREESGNDDGDWDVRDVGRAVVGSMVSVGLSDNVASVE